MAVSDVYVLVSPKNMHMTIISPINREVPLKSIPSLRPITHCKVCFSVLVFKCFSVFFHANTMHEKIIIFKC